MKINLSKNITKQVVSMKFDLNISLESVEDVKEMKKMIFDIKAMYRNNNLSGYSWPETFIHFLEEEFLNAYNKPNVIEVLKLDK